MKKLNNGLLDADIILKELEKPAPYSTTTTLESVRARLKANLFGDRNISDEDIKRRIANDRFQDFPRLKYVITKIFNGKDQVKTVKIPEDLQDWSPSATFHDLNRHYGYFGSDQDLTELFNLLAVAGKKIASIIENQAYDDAMAYKLMALFCDPRKDANENFAIIAAKFAKLVKTKKDKPIQTPYHDAFVVALNRFPTFRDVNNLKSWKTFIEKEGFKSLSIFAECATTRKAFENIIDANEFLLTKQYPRAEEHPELAALCKKLLIKNSGFEAGLAQVQSGWPKKETDSLPLADIADNSNRYFWVKLPPQDMRAMYLGNLIRGCCQFINGHSRQCVIDGMTLSDNGFYVMLKARSGEHAGESRLIGNEVNDKAFAIVAQSYAWKTTNGNLCLDSIEWNEDRVSTDVIQDLMSKFSNNIFGKDPSIKHLTVGTDGQTPAGLYTLTSFPEKMKQGFMYGDANSQYHISSNIDNIDELTKQLEPFSDEFKQAFLYLAPYFEQPNSALETLLLVNESIETELPRFLSKRRVNLPPRLTGNDFKKISFEEYQRMDDQLKVEISTVCKMLNTSSENEFSKWLPTIPDKDFRLVRVPNHYSLETKTAYIKRLKDEEKMKYINQAGIIQIAIASPNASRTLHEVLGMFSSSEDQLALINQKSISGTPIIHLALKNPKALQTILALCPEHDRLEGIRQKDEDKNSVLHLATDYPKSLKMILNLYPESNRLDAVNQTNRLRESVLDKAAENPESLRAILELLPESAQVKAVKQKAKYKKSLLDKAATNPESLKFILESLQESARLKAVIQSDASDGCTLFNAAANPTLLKTIFDCFSRHAQLKAINHTNINGKSVLHSAYWQPESLKVILEPLSACMRLKVIKQTNKFGNSALHSAARNPESLRMILDFFPKSDLLEVVKQTTQYGASVLHKTDLPPESVKMILDLYPESDRLEAVRKTTKDGKSVLHRTADKPRLLKMILDLYPESDRLEAVRKTTKDGKSVLHLAASNYESLKIILDLYPKRHRLEGIKQTDIKGNSVLYHAAMQSESLKMILDLYPESDRLEAINQKAFGASILLYVAKHPESVKTILKLLPENDRLKAVKQAVGYYSTYILYPAIEDPESLDAILKLLPENDRLKAFNHINVDGESVLHWATKVKQPKSLEIILSIYPESDRLEAIRKRDKEGKSVLFMTIKQPEALKVIFKLLPKDNLGAVIKAINHDGKSLFDYACQYPKQLKEIFTHIPENQRYPFVTQKNLKGDTHLSKLIPPYSKQINIKSLKAILELLPERRRLDAALHTAKGTSVLSSAINDPTILKTILELLPKEHVFEEITTLHKENISIADLAKKSPKLLDFFIDVLDTFKKKPEAHDYDDPYHEAQRIIASTFGDSSHPDMPGPDSETKTSR